MDKQYFELIAGVLWKIYYAGIYPESPIPIIYPDDLANAFADALASTNPNFDRERFLAACRGED